MKAILLAAIVAVSFASVSEAKPRRATAGELLNASYADPTLRFGGYPAWARAALGTSGGGADGGGDGGNGSGCAK